MALESTKKVLCLLTVGGALYLGYRASARVLQYVANKYYSSQKYVVIFYPRVDYATQKLSFTLNCMSVEKPYKVVRRELKAPPGDDFFYGLMPAHCTSFGVPRFYLLAAGSWYGGNYKKVYRYDLPRCNNMKLCKDMNSGTKGIIVTQIGNRVYVLGGTTQEGRKRFVLQEYNIDKDDWTTVEDNENIINKVEWPEGFFHIAVSTVVHVVIGSKLHVSLGYYSYTFDTDKRTWKKSDLFETYWLEQEKMNPGTKSASYADFFPQGYGFDFVPRDVELGGLPFDFDGRGFQWDENIFLALANSSETIVIAFLVGDSGRVIKWQQYLGFKDEAGVKLVYLGQDDCFGLVVFDKDLMSLEMDDFVSTNLVIFKVSKLSSATSDAFLQFEVVQNVEVARNVRATYASCYLRGLCM